MPISDRPVEGGHRKSVVISGEEPGRDAVTTTLAAGNKVALDVNITAGAGAGGTSMTDDSAFTPGASGITPAGGYYNSAGEAVDDGDAGALAMTERRALHTTIRTPNDDSAMDDANDAVRVNIVAGGGAGGTSQTDDTAFTPGASSLTPMGAFADETAPDSVDEGDIGAPRMSLNRILYSSIRDGAGNERGANVNATNELEVSVENGAGAAAVNVQDGGNSLTVDDGGAPISVDDNGGSLSVDDNGGSLTVDNAALSVVGGGAEATAQRVTIANDSTGVLTIDDGGGSITVDGTVTVQEPLSVDDNGGSLTVDNPALSVVGGGVEATALRVTVANDSTGVLSVDDNAGSLTVDQATHDNLNANANMQVGDVDVSNGNPVPVSDAGGTLTVDGTVTVQDGGGSISVDDGGAALSVDDNGGSLTVDNATISVVGGGVEATAQRVTIANDSTGVLSVDDNGGSLTTDTAGDVADDAVDSGNPVKIGGVAVETDGTDPGEVAEGDRAQIRTDMNRRMLVNTSHPNAFSTNNNYAAAQTNQQIQAAPGANLSLYITDVAMSADTAGNVALVRNTAASTTIWGPFYFAANGGLIKHFATPIRLPANENLGVTSVNAGNHTISVQGYIAP